MSEQELVYLLFTISRVAIQSIAMHSLHCIVLTPKYGFKKTVAVCSAADILAAYIVEIFVPFFEFLYVAIFLLLFFIPALTAFKEKKTHCILFTSIFVMFIYLSDMLIGLLMGIMGSDIPATMLIRRGEGTWMLLLQGYAENIMYLLIFTAITMLWSKNFRQWKPKISMLFFFFPLSQVLFFSSNIYRTWNSHKYDIADNIFTLSGTVISIVGDVLLFFAIRDSSKLDDVRLRMQEMESEMNLQLNYYESLSEHIVEVREYRHDINNLISAAEVLVKSDISRDEGEKLINDLKEKTNSLKVPVYCKNAIVNAVLWQKKREMDDKGLTLTISINGEEEFPLDKIDICSFFANLLDNAIRETDSGEVSVSAKRDLGMLIITVTNPTSKVINVSEKPKTTKKDRGRHGLGLEIVEKITSKYNGKFVLTAENGVAKAIAAFELK